VLATRLTWTSFSCRPSVFDSSRLNAIVSIQPLEFQTRLASCVSESLHTTVVTETASVKGYLSNACCFGSFRDQGTNSLGSFYVTCLTFAKVFIQGRGSCKHVASIS